LQSQTTLLFKVAFPYFRLTLNETITLCCVPFKNSNLITSIKVKLDFIRLQFNRSLCLYRFQILSSSLFVRHYSRNPSRFHFLRLAICLNSASSQFNRRFLFLSSRKRRSRCILILITQCTSCFATSYLILSKQLKSRSLVLQQVLSSLKSNRSSYWISLKSEDQKTTLCVQSLKNSHSCLLQNVIIAIHCVPQRWKILGSLCYGLSSSSSLRLDD
jgi:hypothetical protein